MAGHAGAGLGKAAFRPRLQPRAPESPAGQGVTRPSGFNNPRVLGLAVAVAVRRGFEG